MWPRPGMATVTSQVAVAYPGKCKQGLSLPRCDDGRRLVESSEDMNADLAKLATDGNHALGRVHALWTLEGRAAISPAVVLDALSDSDRGVRMAAARLAEPWLKLPGSDAISDQLLPMRCSKCVMRIKVKHVLSSI